MIKVKKLTPTAIIPTKAHEEDAGYDIYSDEDTIIPPMSRKLISTGIAIQLPNVGSHYENLYARIAPRSGLSVKYGIDVFAGVVDRGYSGEINVCLFNSNNEEFKIEKGQRIAQLIPTIVFSDTLVEVEKLEDSVRGDKGFGSTGE